jgi:hypothetical protein
MVTALIVLHVTVMFAATAISQGPAFVLWRAMRGGDVTAIRTVLEQYGTLGKFIGPLYGGGVVIGLITVFVGGYDPFALWLLIAYGLTLVAFATPIVLLQPRVLRLAAAAEASPLDAPSPALRDEIARFATPVFWVDAALIVLFIIDMIAKPGF